MKYGPAGAEFSVDPYFTHVFHAMFAGFGSLGAIFYSKKAKNGVLRVNLSAVNTKLYNRRGQKVLLEDMERMLEDMERNAELGISLQMSSTVKCGVSGMNVLWESI